MDDHLVFMMGQFQAQFPTDRQYAANHMWAQTIGDAFRFGFTAYAVRLLQDVYFLDWVVDPDTPLKPRQQIGSIESSKAESDLYAPMPGVITRFNESLLNDPSMINVDKYQQGWIFEMQGASEDLMTPQRYVNHLAEVWVVTQRTIKGQMN